MNPSLRSALLVCASGPVVALLVAALWPTDHWVALLAVQWSPHLAILALPWWCWLGRNRGRSLSLLLILSVALWPWLQAAYAPRAAAPTVAAATLITANLYYASTSHRDAIERLDADLLVLVESGMDDRVMLTKDPRWPYQCWTQPKKWGGLALLSRWPMVSEDVMNERSPLIDARINAPWGTTRVIASHTWAPTAAHRRELHDTQMQAIADLLDGEMRPVIVLGDLNASPADPTMAGLRRIGLLPPASTVPATWPSHLGPLGITIDHVLVRGLAAGEAQAIRLPGSDHHAMRVVVSHQRPE